MAGNLSTKLPIAWCVNALELYKRVLTAYAVGARYVLEIGTGDQESTHVFQAETRKLEGHVWTVDITRSYPPTEGTTYLTCDSLSLPWHGYVDLLYLDGNHEPEHVRQELEKFAPWVWQGGFILMDDLRHGDVPETVRRLESIADEFCERSALEWFYAAPLPNKIGVIPITKRVR